jgi:putative oxidoreductase
MFKSFEPLISLAGRFLLSPIFLASGSMKIMNWTQTAEHMTSEGMVAVPFFLFMAIVVELAGGLSLLLGFKARWGALLLAAFLIPVTLIFHDFWRYSGGEAENQMQHFMKNLTIIGGLLTVAAHGAGAWSLDAGGK